MMTLTTDFECGSGTVRPLGHHQWAVDTVGDVFGYNKYFCFEAANPEGSPAADLQVEIFPDPALGPKSHFLSHFPSHIWYSARDWQRWTPLRHTWEDSVQFLPDRIRLQIPLGPGTKLQIATNPPLRCSELMAWIDGIRRKHSKLLTVSSLGRSFENRDIPVLSIGRGPRRMVVLAGQHASEHSGVWASRGIADFLLSSLAEAARLRQSFTFSIVPMLNPDGNVHGRSGAGAEQFAVNNSLDFAGVAAGKAPLYTENRLLWSWLQARKPEIFLHFHGYMGWKAAGDLPGDALYLNPPTIEAANDSPLQRYQQAILDRVLFDTPAQTSHFGILGENPEGMVDFQLAKAFGTAALLYEVNSATVGVAGQYQRGAQVLRAMTAAVLEADGPVAV